MNRVVVVGAGVLGASVAAHLASPGGPQVVLLDREAAAGGGSTGRATGGFRAQFDTAINVRLSLRSRDKLRSFAAETGVDPGYEATGYLWLAGSERDLATLREGLLVQHAEGLHEAREVSPGEIAALNPAIRLDDVPGGAFCPSDGFIRPLAVLHGYLALATARGARVLWDASATGFERSADGRIIAVRTTHALIACDAVVNAAGPWASQVARWAGVDLPVTPLRRQAAATMPTRVLPSAMPMTIFTRDGFHFRVRDGRVLLLQPTPGDAADPYSTRVEPEWVARVARLARERVPALAEVPIDATACWAGLYEMSPDHHAILGTHPDCPNLFFANGSSGHGVMHAPALGEIVASQVRGGITDRAIVRALDVGRFADGRAVQGARLL